MNKESTFQASLIKKLKLMFPGCFILKNDPDYIQGFPDLLILYKDKWAVLECKRSKDASVQPNQRYYLERTNGMSFGRFIHPDNEEEVLNDLRRTFGA